MSNLGADRMGFPFNAMESNAYFISTAAAAIIILLGQSRACSGFTVSEESVCDSMAVFELSTLSLLYSIDDDGGRYIVIL
jgi:hypothetical protein